MVAPGFQSHPGPMGCSSVARGGLFVAAQASGHQAASGVGPLLFALALSFAAQNVVIVPPDAAGSGTRRGGALTVRGRRLQIGGLTRLSRAHRMPAVGLVPMPMLTAPGRSTNEQISAEQSAEPADPPAGRGGNWGNQRAPN